MNTIITQNAISKLEDGSISKKHSKTVVLTVLQCKI